MSQLQILLANIELMYAGEYYIVYLNHYRMQNMVGGGKWRSDSSMSSGDFKDVDK